MWTSAGSFYSYEHLYTYKKQEFENIVERTLCNGLGDLLAS